MSFADEARAAAGLLTVAPVGGGELSDRAMRGAAAWYPVVGGIVGVFAAAAYAVGEALLGGFYGAALALTVSAIASGALPHVGLAGTADGLGVRGDLERRMALMREPGIGAAGTFALVAFALLAVTALARLPVTDAAAAVVCGHALGRWAAVPQLVYLAPAGGDEPDAGWSAQLPALVLASTAAIAIALAAGGIVAGLSAIAGAAVAAAAMALVARRLVGGRTSETLGAAVLVTEVVVYSVLAAYLSA